MLVVGLGTTIPEAAFSLNAVRKNDDALAVGDIFGTVLADATVVVGILSLVSPFAFPRKIVFVTGIFMVLASIITFTFMKSGKTISKHEAWLLIAFWIAFVAVEFAASF
jgi:cation:H+ antiporter